MIALLTLLLSGTASAREVRLCGQWTPDFKEAGKDDSDGIDANGDGLTDNDKQDRLTTNAPISAHGLAYTAQYRQQQVGGWWSSWTELGTGHLQVGGNQGGCTDAYTVPDAIYGAVEVRMFATSELKSGLHLMPVMDSESNELLGVVTSSTVTVAAAPTSRAEVDLGSGDNRFDAAIVMAWALDREDGGASPLTYSAFVEATGAGGGGIVYDDQHLFLGDDSSLRRILHELGHAVTANTVPDYWMTHYDWTNVKVPHPSGNPNQFIDPQTVCEYPYDDDEPYEGFNSKHYLNSDEASAAAIIEGYANYYAAQTLNRVDQGDCFLQGNQDWDHDGVLTEHANSQWYSCETRPRPAAAFSPVAAPHIDARDYWAAVCDQPPPSSEVNSIASEYDWLRGLWDLDTEEGLTFTDLMAVLADANPHTWWEDPTAPDILNADFLPANRMLDAADGDGLLPSWTSQCNNGICR